MSHVSVVRTKLKDINKNLLKETERVLTELLHINAKYYPDTNKMRGKYITIESDYGILVIDGEPIGFRKDGDAININADLFVVGRDTINKVVDTYISVAIAEVAKSLGYKVNEVSTQQNAINMLLVR